MYNQIVFLFADLADLKFTSNSASTCRARGNLFAQDFFFSPLLAQEEGFWNRLLLLLDR
jgi:hypothetical protein